MGRTSAGNITLRSSPPLPVNAVQLSLIEYTLSHTTLGELRNGQHVHVEGDVIGKYVRRMLAPHQGGFDAPSSLHAQD